MIVIADTTPLNYLIQIDQIAVLPKLYGRILVPSSVCGELQSAKAPDSVKQWIADPPSWLEVCTPTRSPDPALLQAHLGLGERDAILLAQELSADEIIIDETRGRREATKRHLHIIGTLAVLRLAEDEGLLDFRQAIAQLRKTTFRFTKELLDRFLLEDM